MAQPVIQTSFASGEWAPQLNARVDLQKYHQGAALLRNFFVDYRGGATTRAGTKFVAQAFRSATPVRLIPFQASFTVNYVLEFGNFYVRFHFNGAPILEATFAISGATQANPAVLTVTGHNYNVGDWVFISGVVGMTQLNRRTFLVTATTASTITLGKTLDGSNVNSTGYGAYVSGGTVARVYTLSSPYAAADLQLLKYAQNVNTLVICHPSYPPTLLTLVSANNWNLTTITFGATIGQPTGIAVTSTLPGGSTTHSYVVTAVDVNGQESLPSAVGSVASVANFASGSGSNKVTWNSVPGAFSYNVYNSSMAIGQVQVSGTQFGFLANVTGTSYVHANTGFGPAPNFSQTPPIGNNPFAGSGVTSYTVTNGGSYTTYPSVTVAPPPSGGQATASATLGVSSAAVFTASNGYSIGDILIQNPNTNGVVLQVLTVGGLGAVSTVSVVNPGSATGAGFPVSNVVFSNQTNPHVLNSSFNLTWAITAINPIAIGSGYLTSPAVTFSPASTSAATANLGNAAAGNPAVPLYFQQRLYLAALALSPGQFNASIPGSYFNFDTSDPTIASDAIQATLVSDRLNTIKSMIGMSNGLIILTDHQAWIINGGSPGLPPTAVQIAANSQAYEGANDVPPIIDNFDILYIQSKGSIVRDLTFNFYTQIYTGTDISVLSTHLFYGFNILYWAQAKEPFKLIWCVRNDGNLLCLTFLKEQEMVAWTHHDSPGAGGLFKAAATVTETVTLANGQATAIDATYFAVQRTVNGQTVQYIERMAERFVNGQVKNAWAVDAGLQYNGSPTSTFFGFDHLVGQTVTGVADGLIPTAPGGGPIVVTGDGNVTIATAASLVTLGLPFTPQLQTLRLDVGEPTIQGKRKTIPAVTLRCQETLGLSIGKKFTTLVPVKDLVVGNVGTMSNTVVTDLVTDDARQLLDPTWDVPGQYCIQQSNPFPAQILGVIPEIVVGDSK